MSDFTAGNFVNQRSFILISRSKVKNYVFILIGLNKEPFHFEMSNYKLGHFMGHKLPILKLGLLGQRSE